jgi:hypothetical protein
VAVEAEPVAFGEHAAGDPAATRGEVQHELAAADQAHLAELPRDHRRVRGTPTDGGEYPGAGHDAVDVGGRRLMAHKDHFVTRGGQSLRGFDIEGDAPDRDADPGSHRPGEKIEFLGPGDGKLLDALQIDAGEPGKTFLRRDQAGLDLLDRDAQAASGVRLARASAA